MVERQTANSPSHEHPQLAAASGVATMREPFERSEDCVWLVDHSNQIGPEKVLVVMAIRAKGMPPPGETLKHENLRVLTVRPGISWKREDVAQVI